MKEKQLYNVKRDENGKVISRTKVSPIVSAKTIYFEDGSSFEGHVAEIDEKVEACSDGESERVTSENARVEAENARVAAETERAASVSGAVTSANEAAASANSAASSANSAATAASNVNVAFSGDNLVITKRDGSKETKNVKGANYVITESDYDAIADVVAARFTDVSVNGQ